MIVEFRVVILVNRAFLTIFDASEGERKQLDPIPRSLRPNDRRAARGK